MVELSATLALHMGRRTQLTPTLIETLLRDLRDAPTACELRHELASSPPQAARIDHLLALFELVDAALLSATEVWRRELRDSVQSESQRLHSEHSRGHAALPRSVFLANHERAHGDTVGRQAQARVGAPHHLHVVSRPATESSDLRALALSTLSTSSAAPAVTAVVAPTQEQDELKLDASQPRRNMFRREGDYWTVAFDGVVLRLKDTKGMHYIARLLQYPYREFHAVDLVSDSLHPVDAGGDDRLAAGPPGAHPGYTQPLTLVADTGALGHGDAGEILDVQAQRAYRSRLLELRDELADAEAINDAGRAAAARQEIEFLGQELANAVGLGGRSRRAASDAERARVNATRTIRLVLHKISHHHPALGRHLAACIKTGRFCSYQPDSEMTREWQV